MIRLAPRKLTIGTKLKILSEVDARVKSKSQIAAAYDIPRSTLSSILKNRIRILSYANEGKNGAKFRFKSVGHPDVEKCLIKWFRQVCNEMPLTGPILRQKALDIAEELGIQDFRASNGWLGNFKKRYGINISRMCAEGSETDPIDEQMVSVELNDTADSETADGILAVADHHLSDYVNNDVTSSEQFPAEKSFPVNANVGESLEHSNRSPTRCEARSALSNDVPSSEQLTKVNLGHANVSKSNRVEGNWNPGTDSEERLELLRRPAPTIYEAKNAVETLQNFLKSIGGVEESVFLSLDGISNVISEQENLIIQNIKIEK